MGGDGGGRGAISPTSKLPISSSSVLIRNLDRGMGRGMSRGMSRGMGRAMGRAVGYFKQLSNTPSLESRV